MRKIWILAGLVSVICLMSGVNLSRADEKMFSDAYPGLRPDGGARDLALAEVQAAVSAYFQVFGEFPENWSMVRESGLFDKPLVGYHMENIDPDDGHLDFMGDLYLDTTTLMSESGDVLLFSLSSPNGSISRIRIEKPVSYSQRLTDMKQVPVLDDSNKLVIQSWLDNDAQLLQFGHLSQLFWSVQDFREIHGRLPDTLSELVSAGIGPFSAGSMNPLTMSPYRFDGSPGDISYVVADDGRGYILRHADSRGDINFGFSY